MKNKNIKVKMFIRKNGKLGLKPPRVRVNPGDTVTWISNRGALTIEFAIKNNPFRSKKPSFSAAKGKLTGIATVRANVPSPKHFACTVTIGGKVFKRASGVDTPGA